MSCEQCRSPLLLFGAEIVVVGVLLHEGSSEIKCNIYSTCFRFAVQSSGWGGFRIFIGEGLQALVVPFWLIEGVSNLLRGRHQGRKGAISCQKGASVDGRGSISA